ncbi:Phosphoheptose isomerase 1 (EC 5.3.1.-) [uncultured Gammaproteobacteria bacterium]|jgi:D-sedoheptulose 7-phosphate isomerase|uniref:D-sedoheptulose-7-phosphate isomerase n=1 Tax=thiotrophic endosymbiont of Bathymodiolus puteoserpentis (Logatchev) TaxID=343240 RepID=UPI0010B53737|nr:SIS domain-containing protein [thiotrophic endosymbiont of Bathymodiolus puteoserpentis (Logatchev)]CAC9491890.1 Phosphoheptose isomerase 1 (EC 5.3.1.-) [uncultured Gammaproteobacteria bacterium]CAC9493314.1 Phosphoheptose isomerase 1 (EC 5.3.1.-) [uncultured Gammaproteobacteria bacterium]CAC9497053.1 Phosphoheptose isomerase 1 (EC 5.3.1.-) [uncultured Gammaproteobacteria bacterium]CAC9629800.1 Phosphoheptose isomerase 1 (EC 5.3.1.-) [uncultured Gammaproteobacteria bacterium]CAC9651767.1 Ph
MDNNKTLSGLYPFLDKNKKEVNTELLLSSIHKKVADSVKAKQDFFQKNDRKILQAAQMIAKCYQQNGHLFAMGNGGSACDAAHIATEFMHPVTTGRKALGFTNLTADIATMTAVANDVGGEHIFLRQLLCLAQKNDVLIGFSTSGNSDNLIKAFECAKEMGLSTIGFSGQTGGKIAKSNSVDICLTVETDSIHRVQESHLTTYHILWDLVHSLL